MVAQFRIHRWEGGGNWSIKKHGVKKTEHSAQIKKQERKITIEKGCHKIFSV